MKKKQIFTAIAALLMMSTAYAQDDMKTFFKKDTTKKSTENTYGGYGAPFVGITQLDGNKAIIVGGKGGVIKNHHFTFGGVGTAVINTSGFAVNSYVDSVENTAYKNYKGTDSTISTTKNISMGYGGVFFEYSFNYNSPVHLSIPVNIQVGGVKALDDRDKDGASKVRTSSVFVVEPGISLDFNFYKFFVPSLNLGYRYVSGDYSSALSGIYGSLIFKFGKF